MQEDESWHLEPGTVTLLFNEYAETATLHFSAERQKASPILLTLNDTDSDALEAFLEECSYLYAKGDITRSAFIGTGRATIEPLRRWLAATPPLCYTNKTSITRMPIDRGNDRPRFQKRVQSALCEPAVQIEFRFSLPETISSVYDLRKMWCTFLVQLLTGDRLAAHHIYAASPLPSSSYPHTALFPLPQPSVSYSPPLEELSSFLNLMKEIKKVGFTIEELDVAKRHCCDCLDPLQQELPRHREMLTSAFHAEGFLSGVELLSLEYFLESAPWILKSITPIDIATGVAACYGEERRDVTLFVDARDCREIEAQLSSLLAEEAEPIIRLCTPPQLYKDPGPETQDSFYTLRLTSRDQSSIAWILETISRENYYQLALKRKSLKKRGEEIEPVHPLRFLGHIIGDPYLHMCLQEIEGSSIKWKAFVDGFKKRMTEEDASNNLIQYIPSFARQTDGQPDVIRQYIDNKDWEGLVRTLLK